MGRDSLNFLLYCTLLAGLFLDTPRSHAQLSIDIPPAESKSPVTGKPYEAEKIMHTRRVLADGTVTSRDIKIQEARDSKGRLLTEFHTNLQLHANGPETSFDVISVQDPVAETTLTWNSLAKTATLIHIVPENMRALRSQADSKHTANHATPLKPELLGQRVIQGRMTTGRFTEKPVPAGALGNATATVDKREWWTDEDLHLVVLSTTSSPQHGEATIELQSLKLVEPDPSRFHPPDGYTIKQLGPSNSGEAAVALGTISPLLSSPLDLAHAPALSHEDALIKLTSGEPSDKLIAAAVLVKEAQASNDPNLKNDNAYKLARANVGLAEAQQLAESAILATESTASANHPGNGNQDDFNREIALSRYWHTLGYIYFRRDQTSLAKQYMESAWELDPHAYYGANLAHIFDDSGNTAKALQLYRETLNAPGSEREKSEIRNRIQTLNTAGITPLADAPATLNGVTHTADGSAFFDLLYSAASPTPRVLFVSGADALKPLASSISQTASHTFILPDHGPEVIVRRVELTCKANACDLHPLSAQQAKDLLGL